jgi:sialic acid synthase SpsE
VTIKESKEWWIMDSKVPKIVAEIGCNHKGDIAIAQERVLGVFTGSTPSIEAVL